MPRQLVHHHRYFLGIFALYVLVGAFSFIFYKQGSETLFIDRYHGGLMDYVFVFFTHLAEGLSILIIFIALSFARLKYLLMFTINIMVLAIVVHFLKHQVFADHVRPSLFFGNTQHLHYVLGRPVLSVFSFPSGHTATAFSVALMLAIFIRRTAVSMVLLALALLVGLSRIYLLEHFWIDVYFGSIVGVSVTLLVYIALQHRLIHTDSRLLNFSLLSELIKRM